LQYGCYDENKKSTGMDGKSVVFRRLFRDTRNPFEIIILCMIVRDRGHGEPCHGSRLIAGFFFLLDNSAVRWYIANIFEKYPLRPALPAIA